MATVTSLASTVMGEVGEDSSNATLLALFEDWVKSTFEEIGSRNSWRFMRGTETITTVASTADYKLDADARDVLSMRIPATDEHITFTSRSALVDRGVDLEEEGSPEEWYFDDVEIDTSDSNKSKQSIRLWPIPDAVYSVEVEWRSAPTELGSSDHVPLPYEFQFILKDGVRFRYYIHEEKENLAAVFLGLFNNNLTNMIRRYRTYEDPHLRLQQTDVVVHPRLGPVRFPPSHFNNF